MKLSERSIALRLRGGEDGMGYESDLDVEAAAYIERLEACVRAAIKMREHENIVSAKDHREPGPWKLPGYCGCEVCQQEEAELQAFDDALDKLEQSS